MVVSGTGYGDVTATVSSVDLVPLGPTTTSSSGCEAAELAGFVVGHIALMQRGTCTFAVKALNAFAAGAVGVRFFNHGIPGSTGTIGATLGRRQ